MKGAKEASGPISATEVLAAVAPTPLRRGFAVAIVAVLGFPLVWLGFAAPEARLGWRLAIIAIGVGALAFAEWLRRATAHHLVLTAEGIIDSSGRRLCRLDQVVAIDRSPFAAKPTNGLTIRLSEPLPRAWVPGLWWRIGRRVGIGGVTPRAEARMMHDALAALLAERRASGGAD